MEGSSLTFARIINPVCSCGNYVGRFQPAIELELVNRMLNGKSRTTDEDVAEIITDMGIRRICCRNTIIISPVLRLMETESQFKLYTDKQVISKKLDRITIGNPLPKI